MKNLIIVIASQDYDSANHIGLWNAIAEKDNTEVLIINIPADYVVSRLKKKSYRIEDSKKGRVFVKPSLSVLRPLFFVRPEILLQNFDRITARQFWIQIKSAVPDLNQYNVFILAYNAKWIRILRNSRKNTKYGYFLYDEVRYNSNDGRYDPRSAEIDEYACRNSDVVFTMTNVLTESRRNISNRIFTVGNGACLIPYIDEVKLPNSVAFVGLFRDWIDFSLLNKLISLRSDLNFYFVGPIETNVEEQFNKILNQYNNTFYCGKVGKERVSSIYKKFNCVIIPYKINEFTRATRPIKIVESVFSGVPVITIPMDGYENSEFIRFADSAESFSNQIDELINQTIDLHSEKYIEFLKTNSWDNKATIIVDAFESCL